MLDAEAREEDRREIGRPDDLIDLREVRVLQRNQQQAIEVRTVDLVDEAFDARLRVQWLVVDQDPHPQFPLDLPKGGSVLPVASLGIEVVPRPTPPSAFERLGWGIGKRAADPCRRLLPAALCVSEYREDAASADKCPSGGGAGEAQEVAAGDCASVL